MEGYLDWLHFKDCIRCGVCGRPGKFPDDLCPLCAIWQFRESIKLGFFIDAERALKNISAFGAKIKGKMLELKK